MNTLKDLPWRACSKESPPTYGYYLVRVNEDEDGCRLRLWNGGWLCAANVWDKNVSHWCPIIPNKDGSITLGQYTAGKAAPLFDEARELLVCALAYCWGKEDRETQSLMDRIQNFLHKCRTQEALAPEPLEIIYPRFGADYACRKCGRNYWGVHHEAGEDLLKISCNYCYFVERVRPLDYQGKVLNTPPQPEPPSPPSLYLTPLDRATHTCGWRASAGIHWAEAFTYGDALLNLLKMEGAQKFLGINFVEHKP